MYCHAGQLPLHDGMLSAPAHRQLHITFCNDSHSKMSRVKNLKHMVYVANTTGTNDSNLISD